MFLVHAVTLKSNRILVTECARVLVSKLYLCYVLVSSSLAMSYVHLRQLDEAKRTYNLIIELSNTQCCHSPIILQGWLEYCSNYLSSSS